MRGCVLLGTRLGTNASDRCVSRYDRRMLALFDSVRHWLDGIAHLGTILAVAYLLYLLALTGWIMLQKREPVATISWLVSLAALPYIGFFVYHVFGPQKIRRHRLRRRRRLISVPPVRRVATRVAGRRTTIIRPVPCAKSAKVRPVSASLTVRTARSRRAT